MNRRIIFSMLGKILMVEGGLMLLPLICGLIYGEQSTIWFAITAVVTALVGLCVSLISKPKDKTRRK